MELESNELETSLLESADNLADETSLDAVRPGGPSISQMNIVKAAKVKLRYNISHESDTERKTRLQIDER